MDGLSLHYYVHPEGWEIKGSSTDFDADVWYKTLIEGALYGDIDRTATVRLWMSTIRIKKSV